jgi:transposase InsO family protein
LPHAVPSRLEVYVPAALLLCCAAVAALSLPALGVARLQLGRDRTPPRDQLAEFGLRHLRIRPYRPRTNGNAERLIQTLLNEWAYAQIYGSSAERAAALIPYLERYSFRRPHGSLASQPPASALTNVPGSYT